MAKLNLVLPKGNVPDWLKTALITIQNWAANISGQSIEDGTIAYSKLSLNSDDIPVGKVNWPEIHLPLTLPGADVTTTSTSPVRCSGLLRWDPSVYPSSGGSWFFEASLAISNAAGTVTCRLMGASQVASLTHTGDTSMNLKRSSAITMPTGATNLYVDFNSSDADYTAFFGGARLVFVPS